MDSRTAIYVRISDDKTGEEAGVTRQTDDCQKLCRERGWKGAKAYRDNDISAYSGKLRPAFRELMQLVDDRELDRIVVWHMSRLFRNRDERVKGLERLRAAGVGVIAVKGPEIDLSTSSGRLVAHILGEFDTYESDVKGERVARAHEDAAVRGRFAGGRRRMGYSKSADELHPTEAPEVRWAYAHVAAGGSLESVVRRWRKVLGRGPLGGKITGVQVRDVLLRPMNGGLSFYKGKEVGTMTGVPAIVDEGTWRTVVAILSDPSRRTTVGKPALTLLAPVLKCGICGDRVSGRYRTRTKQGTKDAVYACREGCLSRHRGKLDHGVGELLIDYLEANKDALRRPPAPSAPDSAPAEADRLRGRLDALSGMVATGQLEPADFAMAAKKIREQLAHLDKRIARAVGRPATFTLLASDDVRTAWEAASTDEQRVVVRELVDRIIINKARPGVFTMAGIEVHWRDAPADDAAQRMKRGDRV